MQRSGVHFASAWQAPHTTTCVVDLFSKLSGLIKKLQQIETCGKWASSAGRGQNQQGLLPCLISLLLCCILTICYLCRISAKLLLDYRTLNGLVVCNAKTYSTLKTNSQCKASFPRCFCFHMVQVDTHCHILVSRVEEALKIKEVTLTARNHVMSARQQ